VITNFVVVHEDVAASDVIRTGGDVAIVEYHKYGYGVCWNEYGNDVVFIVDGVVEKNMMMV